MNPFELLLWFIAGAAALMITAVAIAVAILIIRSALHAPLGKQKDTA